MKKYMSLGLILLTILFSSCSNDNDDSTPSSSISATINGVDWKPTKINSVAFMKMNEMNQLFEIIIQDDTQILTLICTSEVTTANAMPLKEYNFIVVDEEKEVELTPIEAVFTNEYLIDGNIYTEHQPTSGKMTITAMDPVKKIVSGTFSFKTLKVGVSQNKIATPENYEVKNGVFNNLPYTVTVYDYIE